MMSYEFQYACKFSTFRTTRLNCEFTLLYYRQEFRELLKDTVAGSHITEPEPLEDDSTEPSSVSPPWFINMLCQHLADYALVCHSVFDTEHFLLQICLYVNTGEICQLYLAYAEMEV